MSEPQVRTLAAFVAETSYDDLPETVREQALISVLDTLGVIIAGSTRDELRRLRDRLPEACDAQIAAAGFPRTTAPWAATANAIAASFLELDQGERPTGHPALHVLPTLLAEGQARHVNGRELVTAFVLAYEIQSRIQRSFTLRWPVHPHGTLGTPAAAAGLGKLQRADAQTILSLINCSASLATATSWNSCLKGATVRNAFAATTVQTAFLTQALVAGGFTATADAVAETFGSILGEAGDPSRLVDGLGRDFAIADGYFKFHAACALVHPALDATLDAVGADSAPAEYPPFRLRRTFMPAEVARVRVRTTERAARLAHADTGSELAAKFSIPAAVATLMVHGTSEPSSFRGAQLKDPRVAELAAKVTVESDADLTAAWPAAFSAQVEIERPNGTRLTGRCRNPYGSADNPASTDDLRAKFEHLIQAALGPEVAEQAWQRGLELDRCEDVDSWLDACFTLAPAAQR